MTEIDEVLRIKEEIHDFIDDNYDGEEILRLLSALSMVIVDVGQDAEVSHEDIAQIFIGIINHHMTATAGPSEDDKIH